MHIRNMIILRNSIVIFFVVVCFQNAEAQYNVQDTTIAALLIDFQFTLHNPGGDLADRFGSFASIGGSIGRKTEKNWYFGIEGNYIFGSQVKELDMLDAFVDDNGLLLGLAGVFPDVSAQMRGFNLSFNVGKTIPLFGPNDNSGIYISAGVGFLEHKIKFQDPINEVPMLASQDYAQGYDRLCNGVMLSQFVGYRYMGNRRLLNFIIGFDFRQGFTASRRDFDYDTGFRNTDQRVNFLYGLKSGFTLPLYKRAPEEFYYY